MNRIDAVFARARERSRAVLVPFVTAGLPALAATERLLPALAGAGSDIIELGIPFSDPMADGPVIQRASERALAGGTTLAGVLGAVAAFRRADQATPVVLMGYTNSVEAMGTARFVDQAARAGVDALLLVDLPPEEGAETARLLRAAGLHSIHLVSPTTSPARRRVICESASGFVYYVAVKGTTGGASADVEAVRRDVAALRALTSLPIGIGFGIRTPAAAARMAAIGDAVIVGSALVERVDAHTGSEQELLAMVSEYIRSYRTAMDGAARP